jgi:hypothetical protein
MSLIEPKVKGVFFQRIFQFAKKKLGRQGVADLGIAAEDFNTDRWYPYSDFCRLLDKTQQLVKDTKNPTSFKLGHDAFAEDERWRSLFKDQDPKDIFATNKRQDALFIVGRFEVVKTEDTLIKLRMAPWSKEYKDNAVWAQFYHGVLKGVLDITGKTGQVDIEEAQEKNETVWVYTITWK